MCTIELLSQQTCVSCARFSSSRMKRTSTSSGVSAPQVKKRKVGYAIFTK